MRLWLLAFLAAPLSLWLWAPAAASGETGNAPAARPEAGMPVVQNYSAKDYDAAAQVWAIAQNNRGLMYFGSVAELHGAMEDSWRGRLLGLQIHVRGWSMADEEAAEQKPEHK